MCQLSEKSLIALIRRCTHLKSLDLSYIRLNLNNVLANILQHVRQSLEEIDFSRLDDNVVIDESLLQELKSMPKLKTIICKNQNENEIEMMKKKLPHLVISDNAYLSTGILSKDEEFLKIMEKKNVKRYPRLNYRIG